jgi:hypothetical protein
MDYSISREQEFYILLVTTATHRRKRWYRRLDKAVATGERALRMYRRKLWDVDGLRAKLATEVAVSA